MLRRTSSSTPKQELRDRLAQCTERIQVRRPEWFDDNWVQEVDPADVNPLRHFTAYIDCYWCSAVDWHWICRTLGGAPPVVIRQCRQCAMMWPEWA